MGHAQGQNAALDAIHQIGRLMGTGTKELDLRSRLIGSARGVTDNTRFKIDKALLGVMEIDDGFVQGCAGIIRQQLLKITEGGACIGEDLQIVCNIIGQSVVHKIVHAPIAPLLVLPAALPLGGSVEMKDLTGGISALCGNLATQMLGDGKDIFHHTLGIGENVGVDGLNGILLSAHLHHVGLIDMPRFDGTDRFDFAFDAKAGQNER